MLRRRRGRRMRIQDLRMKRFQPEDILRDRAISS